MRTLITLIVALFACSANAQHCPECTLVDACIREYGVAVSRIRLQARTGEADFQKGTRELNLGKKGDELSQRGTVVLRENMKLQVRFEIDKLKECLGAIR